ncbi:PAS domain-containing protein [Dyadobacter tibetensis]|uniref:PAS domain-containing protein n=1 Tax=Dyadobacter tibetensis TaxID=1211851 RepID=UPI000470C1D9|nr:PAS domain-containing protein [Dyadobacter tibetensis]
MKDSNAHFGAIEVLPIPILVFSASSKMEILACSNAFLPFCRYSAQSVIGKPYHDIWMGTLRDWESILVSDVDFNEGVQKIIYLEDKDFNKFPFVAQVNSILDSSDIGKYYICSFQPYRQGGESSEDGGSYDLRANANTESHIFDNPQYILESLLASVKGIVWEADPVSFKTYYISEHVYDILGYTQDDWTSESDFWIQHLYPADRPLVVDTVIKALEGDQNFSINYRIRAADGRLVWIRDVVTVIRKPGMPSRIQGVMIDISSSKRLEELNRLERKILGVNSKGGDQIWELINNYMLGVEHIYANMHCSLHYVTDNRLSNGSAPSLSKEYMHAINGLTTGPLMGSCGTAVYEKRRIIVKDIASDPRWEQFKDLALKYNLRACWSNPVLNNQGDVIAVFGIYYKEVKLPSEEELMVIDRCTELFRIILENQNKTKLLQDSDSLMRQVQEMAQFGNWQWDMVNNVVNWSDELYRIYGLSKGEFKSTFEGYQALLHPEDRDRVMEHIQYVLHWKRDGIFEERIVRPDGEVRFLKSWCRVRLNTYGQAIGLFGACLDITDNKLTQKQLQASEARLRNLVDSQTNYVIRMDLNGCCTYYNNKYFEDYGWVFDGSEIIGQNPLEIVQPGYLQIIKESVNQCMKTPYSVVSAEFEARSNNGREHSTYWQFKAILSDEGMPEEVQCIGVDITERKIAEDSLRSIAYLQSHVIRAPLARLMGIVDLMKNYQNSQTENDELMDYLLESAQELDGIIRQISAKTSV